MPKRYPWDEKFDPSEPDDPTDPVYEGIGDSVQKQRVPFPQFGDGNEGTPLQLPPPPEIPKPGFGRRLASGLLGAAAGWQNASAGYPGHPKKELDPTAAEQNILGMGEYNRKLKNWQLDTAAKEKQAQINETARKDTLTAAEQRARTAYLAENAKNLAAEREANAESRRQGAIDKFQATNVPESALYSDVTAEPLQTDQSDVEDINDLPVGMPPRPMKIPTPGVDISRYWKQPDSAVLPELRGAGPWMYEPPDVREARKKAADEAAKPRHTVTQADLDVYTQAKVPLPYQLGQEVPQTEWAEEQRDLRKTIAMKPPVEDEALKLQHQVEARTKIADRLKMTGRDREHYIATGTFAQNPPVNNITFPATIGAPRVMPPGQRDEEFLKTLPAELRETVRRYADYAGIMPTGYAMSRNPQYWNNLFDAVSRYTGEQFDPKQYPARQSMENDYASSKRGTTGGNLLSLNTLTGHLGTLIKDLQGLNTGNMQSLNTISQWLSKELGAQAPTNVNLAKAAVTTELASALKGLATEGEIQKWVDAIKPNMSPEQTAGANRTLAELMGRRYREINEAYYRQTGRPWRNPISSSAEAMLQSTGIDTRGIKDPSQPYLGYVGAQPQAGQPGGSLVDDLVNRYRGK